MEYSSGINEYTAAFQKYSDTTTDCYLQNMRKEEYQANRRKQMILRRGMR